MSQLTKTPKDPLSPSHKGEGIRYIQGDESKTEMPRENAVAPFILTGDGTRSCVYRTFQVRKEVNKLQLHKL